MFVVWQSFVYHMHVLMSWGQMRHLYTHMKVIHLSVYVVVLVFSQQAKAPCPDRSSYLPHTQKRRALEAALISARTNINMLL